MSSDRRVNTQVQSTPLSENREFLQGSCTKSIDLLHWNYGSSATMGKTNGMTSQSQSEDPSERQWEIQISFSQS